jgi:hypothetical protein
MRRWTEYVDDATGRPLDARVANDSLVLHGQVCFQPEGATFEGRSTFLVGGTGGFTMPPDGRVNAKLWGKRYAHPPNRPNDRSRLVPWKPTWGVPAYMVVGGQRMDVRKALAMMKGAEADEVLDVAEGEAIPEQKLASEEAVDASRAAFRRELPPKPCLIGNTCRCCKCCLTLARVKTWVQVSSSHCARASRFLSFSPFSFPIW